MEIKNIIMILKKDNDNSPQMTSPHCEKNRGKETMAGSCFTFRSVMINNGSPATTQISAVMIINGFNPLITTDMIPQIVLHCMIQCSNTNFVFDDFTNALVTIFSSRSIVFLRENRYRHFDLLHSECNPGTDRNGMRRH